MTSRSARLAAYCLLALHAVAALPGFFAPYGYAVQDRDFPYAPPTRLHFFDARGTLHLVPFIYGLRPDEGGSYAEDTSERYPLRFFARGDSYRLLGLIPSSRHLVTVDAPGRLFLMGSDALGRDLFSRLVYGGTVSLYAGLFGAALALALGGLIGALAGFYGGRLDSVLMRTSEVFMALPWLYLLIAARAIQPLDTPPARALLIVILILGGFGWPRPARLIRGVAASIGRREHVLAARGFGASDLYLLRRHVLPRTGSVIWTQGALLVPQFVLAEVGLSFLGVGVSPSIPSWGNMLGDLQHFHVLTSDWWWLGFPGLALVFVTLAYHLLARGATVTSG